MYITMSVKYAVLVTRILNSHPQCVKIVRHYPRWTCRRPVGIVEDTSSREERERWKLNVEREMTKDSHSKTVLSATNSSTLPDSYIDSNTLIPSRNNVSDESYLKNKTNLETQKGTVSVVNATKDGKQENFRDIVSTSASEGASNTEWNVNRSNKDISFKNETRKHKQTMKILEKRKIYDAKEIEGIIKLKESADKLGVPVFTDLGTNDTILSQFLTNVKSRKKREKNGKILLEGKRLIRDALDAGAVPEAVFFSRIKDLRDLNLPREGVKIYKITYKKLSLWSDVTTSQGVLAILETPDVNKERPATLPLTVICDNVRDPGNLGTILRTCAGIGCKKVILTKGCVDLWEPRVLRAGAGAHFRLSITQAGWDTIIAEADEHSCVCIAENKITRDFVSHQSSESNSGGTTETEWNSDRDLQRSENSKEDCELLLKPVVPYYALDYASLLSVVLIVGGETEGVSPEAYRFASEANGVSLNIPLSNNVDSLNCGTALSVIAFEMKKQFLAKTNSTDRVKKECNDDSQDSKASVMNI